MPLVSQLLQRFVRPIFDIWQRRNLDSVNFLFSALHLKKIFFTCLPFEANKFPPYVVLRITSVLAYQSYRSVATEANFTEHESMNEALKQILLAAEVDPVSFKESCSIFIEKLCRFKDLPHAAHLLKCLRDKQIYLRSDVYEVVLASAAEENNFELSSSVFMDLLRTTKSQRSMYYLRVARAYRKIKDSDPLLKFIREVSEITFPRNTTIINKIIVGFAVYGKIEEALLIFEHMKNFKCKPDTVSFNIILDILGKAGWVEQMLSVFSSMKLSDCDPEIVTYNTLINNSRKMGRFDLILNFMQEMIKRGIGPDLRTYTALVDGFGRSGNVEGALELYNEMKRKRIRPTFIYRSLISNLQKVGMFELAQYLSEEMKLLESELVGPKRF